MLLLLVICQLMFVLNMQKNSDHVPTKPIHCYNNTVSVDDVATSEKDCESLTESSTESDDGSDLMIMPFKRHINEHTDSG